MNNHNTTPLFDGVKKYALSKVTCFDVPGHKMGAGINELTNLWGSLVLSMDINSSPAVDNLSHPTSIIQEAEVLLADAYKCDNAFMLVNGSTSGILYMIMSVLNQGDKIILPRNVHKSAINALILSGAKPIFINSEIDVNLGIANNITLKSIQDALDLNQDVKALLILHPTYFGVTTDLEQIIKYCHKRNIIVLVDQAHGAHFGFHENTPVNASSIGADLTTTSLHKTGGALTQASVLLHNNGLVSKDKVRSTINLLQTTSASYLITCSIDVARKQLVLEGKQRLEKLYELALYAKQEINNIAGLSCITRKSYIKSGLAYDFDELKLVIDVKGLGVSGFFIYDLLKSKYNIQIELAEPYVILAIISFGDNRQSIHTLIVALQDISLNVYSNKPRKNLYKAMIFFPKIIMTPRDAYYHPKKEIPIKDSIRCISGESIMIYPPGIPIIIPGELITTEFIEHYNYLQTQHVLILKDSQQSNMIQIIDKNMEENLMDLWYTENHQDDTKFSIKVNEHIHSEKSEFQQIDFFRSNTFGTFFTLDGLMMVTEKDEFIYHDMITHVPMAVNPNIRNVLIIGGGDGGTAREVLRYNAVEHVDMVEIDEKVVRLCQKYLPITAAKLDNDDRLKLHFVDGLKFVQECDSSKYDLILVDSTDPIGPGEGLFTFAFYNNCKRILTDDGILINQHESPYYDTYAHEMKRAHSKIKETFPIACVYQFHMPTYPSGHWLFGFASKKYDPITDLNAEAWNNLKIKTKYYNTDLHIGAFMLPNYVKEALI